MRSRGTWRASALTLIWAACASGCATANFEPPVRLVVVCPPLAALESAFRERLSEALTRADPPLVEAVAHWEALRAQVRICHGAQKAQKRADKD